MAGSEPYRIRLRDRVFAVGKTGVGKSTAVRVLVWDRLDNVAWYDMTGQEAEKLDAPTFTSMEDVEAALFPEDPSDAVKRFVYSPEVPTLDDWDRFCHLCYEARNIHIVADELAAVYRDSGRTSPTKWHHRVLSNGRKMGVGHSGATQRPAHVPLACISECEHILVFRLKLKTDRDRMKDIIGEAASQAMDLPKYEYLYDHDDMMKPDWNEPLPV
jgi:hypothetical protein